MRMLALSPLNRLAGLAPLIVRVIVGVIMAAHWWQKLSGGPANFGGFLAQLGVPLPTLMAWVVTLVELVGGVLLVVGLIAPPQQGAGAELDLALIAGFLVILFAGPGSLSLDRALGFEGGSPTSPQPRA